MRAGNALVHRAGSSLSSTLNPTDFKRGHPFDHIDTTLRRMRVLRLCIFPCMYVSTFFVVFVSMGPIYSENTSWKATPTQSEIDCLESGSALPALLGPCCWCKCLAADADADSAPLPRRRRSPHARPQYERRSWRARPCDHPCKRRCESASRRCACVRGANAPFSFSPHPRRRRRRRRSQASSATSRL